LTAEATVIGSPNLRPGIHVNLSKLEAPFDGIYYVTKSEHTIDNSGYQTKLSLRRPGMLDPSLYPFAPLRLAND
jgi:phage protein D